MNCLRFNIRTGLLTLVAVLLVGAMMPVVAGAAEEEMGLFDPFALSALISASAGSSASTVAAIQPMERTATTLRVPKVIVPQRPALRSPFQPSHPGSFNFGTK
jgi:hypothetical protein